MTDEARRAEALEKLRLWRDATEFAVKMTQAVLNEAAQHEAATLKALEPAEEGAALSPWQEAMTEAAALVDSDEAGALRVLERAINPLRPVEDWQNEPEPAPVLWRDPGQIDSTAPPDCVLSVGEVAILASAGGLGKSYLTLEVAAAAIAAWKDGGDYGRACGLRVRPGPVVVLNYEDHPVRIARRMDKPAVTGDVHLWPDPLPLWQAAGEAGGESQPCPQWATLWQAVRRVRPALVVIDPVSASLADVSTSETGPVRAFLRALNQEAARAETGVLLVAHDTKSARNEALAGRRSRRGRGGRKRGLVRWRARRSLPAYGPRPAAATALHEGQPWPAGLGGRPGGAAQRQGMVCRVRVE